MNTNLRPSGIEGLGDMSWGTHFCLFYETKEDLLDFFIPFLQSGLERQEFCLCVASEPLIAEEAERAMREAIPHFERYLAAGQIEITPHTDWYLKEGYFDEQSVLRGWITKLDQALAKGFPGLRFAANFLLDKPDWESFLRFEAQLEDRLHELRIKGLCAYDLNRYSAANMLIERELREAESRRERRRAEERNKYHARLLRHLNDAVIAIDNQFRITAWNRAAERIYGWTAAEVMGRNVDEVLRFGLSQEDQEKAQEFLRRESSYRSERIHSRRNGQIIYVEENTIALTNEHGQITGYVSVNRDVTERKLAEEAFKENARLLTEAQRIGQIGSWSYDLITDTLQYSDEMYRLFDVSPNEFPRTSEGFLNLIYQLDHPAAVQWMEDIKSGSQPGTLTVRIFHKNGELRYIQCTGAIRFDSSGKPVRFVGMAQDITEHRLAEIQIRQQLEHLSTLRKIDQAIASNLNLHFTLNTLLSEVRTQLQVDAADILLLNSEEQALEFAAGQGFRTYLIDTARVPVDTSYAGRAVRERRLVAVEHLEVQPGDPFWATLFAEENFVSYFGVPLIAKGKVEGVLEVFHRTPLHPYPEWLDILNTLAGQAAIAIENATLFENLQQSNRELSQAYDATIEGWSRTLDLRDKETEGHTQRVTEMTFRLASNFEFSKEDLLHIRWGALLHDIGKMGVPDSILLKPETLTEEELIIMRKHPQYAYDLLKPIAFLAPALDIPYCHHEKWDGTGYPRGLKGEEIPLTARLFAVVDVWDALRSDRSYRPPWSAEDALAYIREQSGKHFDPQVVEAFLKMIE